MKYFFLIIRVILGVIFLIYGLNGFLGLIPNLGVDGNLTIAQANLVDSLRETNFFFPFLNIIQIILGCLLIVNFFTPLVLIILIPISLNIFFFHFYLGTNKVLFAREMFIPILVVMANVLLIIYYSRVYLRLFPKKARKVDD